MKFASMVQPSFVLVNARADDAETAIQMILDHAEESGEVKLPSNSLAMILERERNYPTGIGGGVAIPHTNCLELVDTFVAVGYFPEGVNFGGPDGVSKLIVLLLSPPGNSNLHLKMLARISRLTRGGIATSFEDSPTPESLIEGLAECEKEFLEL
jgi:mannitol/fructose-specific phosphotransferase system IIA component (Ntr-type)